MNKLKMLKKGGLIALGLASITTKKTEKMVNELVKKGKLSRNQGEALARKTILATLNEQKKIRKEVEKSARRVMSVTKQEAARLMKQARIPKFKKKTAKKKAKKRRRR